MCQIQRAATKAGINVRTMCNEYAQAFDVRRFPNPAEGDAYAEKSLAKAADVDRDHFIRTTEPDHRFAVQHFWVSHLLGL